MTVIFFQKKKKIDEKNRPYCFIDYMINIKNLNPNKMKVDENSYSNIPI